jgi:hypothetical protein
LRKVEYAGGGDGEGELGYEMLWARNQRKVEYAGAKMMVSGLTSMMILSMMVSKRRAS